MNPLLRYRLVTLCLTTLLLIVALAYAAQSFQVATLRGQKRQLRRENREQREEIARLRLIPANHAVYAFILSRLASKPNHPTAANPLLWEVDDEELCAAYDARPEYICSPNGTRNEEELNQKMKTTGVQFAGIITQPKWEGNRAQVRVSFYLDRYPVPVSERVFTVQYSKGKVGLVKEEHQEFCLPQ